MKLRIPGLLLVLALPGAALAKSPKSMTDDELLVAVVQDKSESNRVKAADEVGKRFLEGAIPTLVEACRPVETDWVCEHALKALEAIRVPASKTALASVLLDERLSEYKRKVAMRALGRVDDTYLGQVAPRALSRYRSMDGDFAKPLIQALVKGGNTAVMDLTIVIARDIGAKRMARIAALDAAEAFNHPNLFEAYVALLEDDDKVLRTRCAKELGRAGFPADVVVPPLIKAAWYDQADSVRAAAFRSLKGYASPELVPLLNHAVLNERNPMAWIHAIQLFEALADSTSVGALDSLLRNTMVGDTDQVGLIRAAVRIGDASLISALQTRLDDAEEVQEVKTAAAEAIALLTGPPAAREVFYTSLVVPEVVFWTPQTTVTVAPLSVSVDASGLVMWGELESTLIEVRVE